MQGVLGPTTASSPLPDWWWESRPQPQNDLCSRPVPQALSPGGVDGTGEYVSVSTQRDTERDPYSTKNAENWTKNPEQELAELMAMYEDKGLSPETARIVAEELTAQDVLSSRRYRTGNESGRVDEPGRPLSSAIAFVTGALLPLLAIVLLPAPIRIAVTFAVVVVALAATGTISAWLGEPAPARGDANSDRRGNRHDHHLRHRAAGRRRGNLTYAFRWGVPQRKTEVGFSPTSGTITSCATSNNPSEIYRKSRDRHQCSDTTERRGGGGEAQSEARTRRTTSPPVLRQQKVECR